MTRSWQTRLIHSDAEVPAGYRSLVAPVFRGSTTVFDSSMAITDSWRQHELGWTYGLYGTPTTLELAARVAELEGGFRSFITPGGQSALALINLAFTQAGDHVLIPDSVYSPHRQLADGLLRRYGVEAEYYEPTAGAGIEPMLRERTRLVWCESPGSITMEVQDVPAIAEAAHRHGAKVAMDNTYSAGVYFDAFGHGVDIATQALTKYIGGHSDLLLGSVTVRERADYERVGGTMQMLGMSVSPDECSLALRGMQTLAVRLEALERSTLEVARWLAEREEIVRVLHPALPSCSGHELWRRDFTGSTSVFSVELRPEYRRPRVRAFVDALELFEIGWSWGGVTSLAVPVNPRRTVAGRRSGALVRINVGLERPSDLIADLERGLGALAG
ncbi:MAG TPA: cystathionine beta-lyase [Gemmatimonadaceae bacterium]|jgi:cystathionine beta-lyase|nr:cystathionine beta-lyase [Gemmatimonadaceae bacterium]